MTLSFNTGTGDYIYLSNDVERAEKIGLTLSSKVRGPQGQKVWFTKDPYAAVVLWDDATAEVHERLGGLRKDIVASWAKDSDRDFPRPRGLDYLPYQRAGIEYALGRRHTLIGDQPGLGKTIQAIGIANAIEAERVLVICPASIRLNWQREVRTWSLVPRLSTQPVLKAKDGINPYAHYTFISYDLARHVDLHEALCSVDWDLIVIDEAHYLKTEDAQRTRAMFGGGRKAPFNKRFLAERTKHIVALTGTPLPNRPRECFTLARGLCWESIDWSTYDDFCYRFNPSARMETGFVREEKGRLPELQARLRSHFMVRRLKSEVLEDLPDKRYEMSYVEPNGAIREVLAHERLIDFDPKKLFSADFEIDGQISTVRREMGEAMAPRVVEHMKYLLDIVEIPKIVMFAHHRSVIKHFVEELQRYGIVTVQGGMGARAKQASVDTFVHDPKARLFLGQLDAAGFGIDGLQKVASHVVVAEPAWTPGTNEQAIDRCHRIGQHSNVVAQFMVVEGSMNERVLSTVLSKAKTTHEALDARGELP